MPLAEPPDAANSLADLPSLQPPFTGRTVYRVWRHIGADGDPRQQPWWFASAPADPRDGGRFDLPAPMGTCSTATTAVAAVLEALQAHLVILPRAELSARRLATIVVPRDAPNAADLTHPTVAGSYGITAALWAGTDRALTQRWAAAVRRDGWWALHAGVQHDPSGQLRSCALFDHEGEHEPTYGSGWTVRVARLDDNADVHAQLASFGVTVRDPGILPFADPR
jgi:hypothetical protein